MIADCGLRIADCGLQIDTAFNLGFSVAVEQIHTIRNPQPATRNPHWPDADAVIGFVLRDLAIA